MTFKLPGNFGKYRFILNHAYDGYYAVTLEHKTFLFWYEVNTEYVKRHEIGQAQLRLIRLADKIEDDRKAIFDVFADED